ncbi:glucuronate isomerase [Halobacillus salinarum]|uniref:Uronate isomerase n=1 Tax=Halobacillus salinarum TaxID=2932257 RepID=A0ABY4EQQ9_9BACI|nr:glucuronate isomerase [Halobacillus salinarum]UOQ46411.1 glucuronate isomerase [Halobacillus salinarum]
MDERFLLNNETAVRLYETYAKDMPIIDYHCHLSPKEIYENKPYHNITEVWLYGDHYKWRAMRANGMEEAYVTGDASDYEKFLAYARTVPMTVGNPLYHWTHLELERYFGVKELLNEETAPAIWETVNEKLQSEGFSTRDFITKSKVEVVCTTDDPTDSLEYHQLLKEEDLSFQVLPSFRPDKGLELNKEGFKNWVEKLGEVSHIPIRSYEDFLAALESRIEFFHAVGGRVSDHALDTMMFAETTMEEASTIFKHVMTGAKVSKEEEAKYKSFTLKFLAERYASHGWIMQFHINALRNNNSRMLADLGPDTGYDSMNDEPIAKPLVHLLDSLEKGHSLPKTVLYSLNPNDNPVLAAITGSFQGGGVPGKIQFGTAWWFNDHKEGMLSQMKTLANIGLLSRFIGMLTDSRSFLSYTRHEYFRRLFCDLLGEWVEKGEIPNDEDLLKQIVQGVSYENAKQYLGFEEISVSSSSASPSSSSL